MASSCSAGEGARSPPMAKATSVRNRTARARQVAIKSPRNWSRGGAGHNTEMASVATAAAISQPTSRSGIDDVGARRETGRMKASSSEVVVAVITELTTPAKMTTRPTSATAAAASHAAREASVPMQTSMPLATASAIWFCTRTRIGPAKSTSNNMAKEPRAAKVAIVGLPMTLSPMANSAGMTIAVRPARRRAARSRSRARSQVKADIRESLVVEHHAARPRPRSSEHASGLARPSGLLPRWSCRPVSPGGSDRSRCAGS
jgi:hypothetical protein